MKDTTSHEIIERLMESTNSGNESILASRLGVTAQAVNNAIRKNKIPHGWIYTVSTTYGVSSDWLFYGTGPMYRESGYYHSLQTLEEELSPSETSPEALPETSMEPPVKTLLEPCKTCDDWAKRYNKLEIRYDALEKKSDGLERKYDALEKRYAQLEDRREGLLDEHRDLSQELRYLRSENYELKLVLERMGGRDKKDQTPEQTVFQYVTPTSIRQQNPER